ncbi:MAG TPA: thioredoxin domain-containing protein [Candidatus Saccharimonadales bacterium]|nr:thioredoxin domain-containing protein [Candidatus Saccharimonadales bacterium]
MSKGFWGVIVIIMLIFVGIFALNGQKTADSPDKSTANAKPSEHIEGKGSTGITLVEYGDFQCPFCAQYYPTVKQIQSEYSDRIFFQFRNYPLTNLHQNAFAASRAAEAASIQNKFWEMHDALYETQDQWSSMSDASSFFNKLAEKIGLDTTKFKADYGSSRVNNVINADLAAGAKLKVEGTPAFFLDGKKISTTQDPDSFRKAIDAAIANKKKD